MRDCTQCLQTPNIMFNPGEDTVQGGKKNPTENKCDKYPNKMES